VKKSVTVVGKSAAPVSAAVPSVPFKDIDLRIVELSGEENGAVGQKAKAKKREATTLSERKNLKPLAKHIRPTVKHRRAVSTVSAEKTVSIEKSDAVATLAEAPAAEVTPVEMPQFEGAPWGRILGWLAGAWKGALKQLGKRPAKKRLRVCESVSLGEKRFVAVIEVDGEQFLVGGASSSVATLARLQSLPKFSDVLKRQWVQEPVQA
jgi:hypothetical protein